jgi:hypothetical protein
MATESSEAIDVNKLLDKPYSELTDEEIEAVIDFRASVKARDKAHAERLQTIRDASERIAAQQHHQVQEAHDAQDALLQASLKRLNRLNGGA